MELPGKGCHRGRGRGGGTPFLDPLGRSWVAGTILPDGVHPTYEGHAKIAQWLVGGLRKYGFGPDV